MHTSTVFFIIQFIKNNTTRALAKIFVGIRAELLESRNYDIITTHDKFYHSSWQTAIIIYSNLNKYDLKKYH